MEEISVVELQERLAYWTKTAHGLAREKGWWDGLDTLEARQKTIPEKIALIHSEITEMLEAMIEASQAARRDGGFVSIAWTDEQTGKPEGTLIELADVLIRCFDLAGAVDIDLWGSWMSGDDAEQMGAKAGDAVVALLHKRASAVLEAYREPGSKIGKELALLMRAALTAGNRELGERTESAVLTVWEAMELKHKYNVTRPRRHGGKVA